jgi:hypothetical protein
MLIPDLNMAANPVIVGRLKPFFLGSKSKVKDIWIISLELCLYNVSEPLL